MSSAHRRPITKLQLEAFEQRLQLTASFIFEPHEIDITSRGSVGQARSAYAADVDGDGDLDVVSASKREGTIAWHENTDGKGTFRPQRFTISNQADSADFVVVDDINGDGAPDVLYASSRNNLIAWYENLDGDFSDSRTITSNALWVNSIVTADVDGDGDVDVLSASREDNTVAWYKNMDGNGSFGAAIVLTDQAANARSVYAADLDGDGDVDVLSASVRDDTIAWQENQNGIGSFGERIMISEPDFANSRANFVSAADIDGDGDLDVLAASYLDDLASWYENTDGTANFGSERVIMEVPRDFARIDSVFAADLDGDGDLDVVSGSEFGHETFWAENLDGRGTFGDRQLIGPTKELTGGSFQFADLDGDGDTDILAASDHEGIIAWHENRLVGDSNDDGAFDTADLTRVFQAAEYRDGVEGNSTFEEGDWNLDGDFDSSDLILAFQAGTYRAAIGVAPANWTAVADELYSRRDAKRNRAFLA